MFMKTYGFLIAIFLITPSVFAEPIDVSLDTTLKNLCGKDTLRFYPEDDEFRTEIFIWDRECPSLRTGQTKLLIYYIKNETSDESKISFIKNRIGTHFKNAEIIGIDSFESAQSIMFNEDLGIRYTENRLVIFIHNTPVPRLISNIYREDLEKMFQAEMRKMHTGITLSYPHGATILADEFCLSALQNIDRLKNYIWEVSGAGPSCQLGDAKKIRNYPSGKYYYASTVSCEIPRNDEFNLVTLNQSLTQRGHYGHYAKLSGDKIVITGETSTRACDNYFYYDADTRTDRLCRLRLSSDENIESLSTMINRFLGIRPTCTISGSTPVFKNNLEYYYVGYVSCVIDKNISSLNRNDIARFQLSMKDAGYGGYYLSEDTNEIRISGSISTQSCKR